MRPAPIRFGTSRPVRYYLKPNAPGYCLAGDIDFVRITLDGTEGPQQVDLRLTRAGSVEGRVTEADGRPIDGATVFLSRLTPQNKPMPGRMLVPAKTDAGGAYRFADVQPGQYRLYAKPYDDGRKPLDQRDDRSYTECYYPAGSSADSSAALTVSPSRPLAGMDIRCGARPPGFTASGRAVDGASGDAVPGLQLIWGAIDASGGAVLRDNVNLRSDDEGRFTITGLVPGTYWVGVFNQRSGERYGRPVFFDVATQSVRGVDVPVNRGSVLSGLVVADPPGSIAFDRPPINILFRPTQISTTFVPRGSSLSGLFQKSATVSPDGRFVLEGVPPRARADSRVHRGRVRGPPAAERRRCPEARGGRRPRHEGDPHHPHGGNGDDPRVSPFDQARHRREPVCRLRLARRWCGRRVSARA